MLKLKSRMILFLLFINSHHAYSSVFKASANLLNFNSEQEQKIFKALNLIQQIIPSAEFRDRVINKKFRGKKIFVDNQGLTNEQIYQKIITSAPMRLELKLYNEESNTIGYTYPNIIRIYINEKYFNKFSIHEIADNLIHEWLHKIGFNHEFKYSESRDHSVPYSVGHIVKELGNKHLSQSPANFSEFIPN
ncbi:MAG: hypothetical protein AB7I27_11055 [Bacteriovoracaceae bacterium]